jgi:cephalosporin-C deacetylase-like acetyl esterase
MPTEPLRRLRLLVLLIVLLAASLGARADAPSWDQLKAYYSYDATQPLAPQVETPVDRGTMTAQTIRFRSVNDQTVPATLCRPKGTAKPPVILFLHGLGGNRSNAEVALSPIVCPQGIATFAIDAAHHGERKTQDKDALGDDPAGTVSLFQQTIIDNRRAIDYLLTRDDLDASRLTLVGVSMGSIMGSILTAVDERIRAPFLVVGGGDMIALFTKSDNEVVKRMREKFGDLGPLRDRFAYIEPTNFAAHIAPRPLAMLNGKSDPIVPPPCAQALFDAAADPKSLTWYEGGLLQGHFPPLQVYLTNLTAFVKTQILAGR